MSAEHVLSEAGVALLEQLRRLIEELPEVDVHIDGFGHRSFRIKDKPFMIMGENEGGGKLGFSVKATHEMQEILLQQGRYTKTPYIGQHGWVSVKDVETVDWDEVRQLLTEAYLRVAPKRLTKALLQK